PNALGKVVRGVIIHNWMAAIRGIESTPECDAMQITGAAPLIEHILEIDSDPIDVKRPAERRMIGFCYHFAVLHCALLRAKGVAARTRCGFASYFDKGKWVDHWVVEYWDGDRWHLHDPQIGRAAPPCGRCRTRHLCRPRFPRRSAQRAQRDVSM
ncbi:MAG: transglutaminase-like domain-containing protein, partial [Ilumatobacteraceae bacterium]